MRYSLTKRGIKLALVNEIETNVGIHRSPVTFAPLLISKLVLCTYYSYNSQKRKVRDT